MEDLKWLLRKCGLLILLLLIFVIVGVICWGKMHEEEQKVAEGRTAPRQSSAWHPLLWL